MDLCCPSHDKREWLDGWGRLLDCYQSNWYQPREKVSWSSPYHSVYSLSRANNSRPNWVDKISHSTRFDYEDNHNNGGGSPLNLNAQLWSSTTKTADYDDNGHNTKMIGLSRLGQVTTNPARLSQWLYLSPLFKCWLHFNSMIDPHSPSDNYCDSVCLILNYFQPN